jgi:tetratricopeptide (TPR) repeat protein
MTAEPLIVRAIELHRAGALEAARELYLQVLDLDPDQIDAMHLLGVVHHQRQEYGPAERCYRRALDLRPEYTAALANIGVLLHETGREREAIDCLRRSLEQQPQQAGVLNTLGLALAALGRAPEAQQAYHAALALTPDTPEVLHNLANTLAALDRNQEALALLRRVIALRPGFAEAYNSLGNILASGGRDGEAFDAYAMAVALKPGYVSPLNNKGKLLREQGNLQEAEAAYLQALLLDPSSAEAHWGLAHVYLLLGRFTEGWKEYEWRWKLKEVQGRDPHASPRWQGEDIAGKRIVLYAEQGLGDAIQFIRYARLAADLGAEVIVQVPHELVRLFHGVPGVKEVMPVGSSVSDADYHAPMLSLPHVFAGRLDTVPATVPYLLVPERIRRVWTERVQHDPPGLKIGLVWAGSPTHINDRDRSCSLEALAQLGFLRDVQFYSIQTGSAAVSSSSTLLPLIDHTAHLTDVLETAGLIEQLDLIITVDTMVAHLAGALGKPVWVLIPFAPDWRWMLDREDSPWYPTMRLFRQARPGTWESTVRSVFEALQQEYARAHAEPPAFSTEQTLLNALDLHRKGLMKDAECAYRAVLGGESTNADALYLLSVVLFQQGAIDEALHFGEAALRARPDSPEAFNAVGNCLRSKGNLSAAEGMFRGAIALRDEYADAHYNLGACLCDAWRLEEAEEAFRAALRTERARPHIWNNLGLVKYRAGRMDEALEDYSRCLSIAPDFADAHWNLAHMLLQLGSFREGWREYEWRWKKSGFQPMLNRHPGPRWNGEDLKGRSLLVWAEQGFGDMLQFLRFVPLMCSRGAIVHMECPSVLRRLVERVDGVTSVTDSNQPLPPFDVQVPLMSLPGLLGTVAETIPARVPYLFPDEDSCEQGKQRLTQVDTVFRVGIVWSGSCTNPAGSYRSIPIDLLAPLADIRHVQFVNLQTGDAALEFGPSAFGTHGIDWTVSPADFMVTAGVIEHLDLVITIDTAVAHLAGGMGKPVWTLLARPWDWRWGMDGDRTPWYPTMRLYRQEVRGSWQSITSQLTRDLEAVVAFRVGDKTLSSAPDACVSLNDLGVALLEARRPDEAIPLLVQAVSSRPDFPTSHFNLALAFLVTGEWKQGFEEYEWRLRTDRGRPSLRPYEQPRLTGLPPKGSTVYLYAEQGFGDAIQFVRYARLLAEHQIHVIVECRKELFRLMQMVQGVGEVIVRGEQAPRFDFHSPLLSLPLVFHSTAADVPAEVPYVHVGHDLRRKWGKNLAELPRGRKIGLVWAGNPQNTADPRRSVPAEELIEVLTGTKGVIVNLQKGGDPAPVGMADWTGSIQDFADTAALIEQLDLVISVDTAVAHLAGALGKPVWTLVQYAPDWRWMLGRTDTPWYPTMRLFRQIHPTSWCSTLRTLKSAVQEWFDHHEP